jgi:hypothetical protein
MLYTTVLDLFDLSDSSFRQCIPLRASRVNEQRSTWPSYMQEMRLAKSNSEIFQLETCSSNQLQPSLT